MAGSAITFDRPRSASTWWRDARAQAATVLCRKDESGAHGRPRPRVRGGDHRPPPSPALLSILERTKSRTEHFEILGMPAPLPTDQAWLPLRALVRGACTEADTSVEEALAAYHAIGEESTRNRDGEIDARTIGTFRNLCVVIGGPGSGKSLLLEVLAREFSKDSLSVQSAARSSTDVDPCSSPRLGERIVRVRRQDRSVGGSMVPSCGAGVGFLARTRARASDGTLVGT